LIGVWKEDVELHVARLRVTRSLVEGVLGPTKNGKTRHIPLSDDACAAFDRQMGRVPGPYVFGQPDGSPLMTGRLVAPFKRALARAG
jgi:integrase